MIGNLVVCICVFLFVVVSNVAGDSWNPVRHRDENTFFKANTHERSGSLEEMNKKIYDMRARRKFVEWHASNNTFVKAALDELKRVDSTVNASPGRKRPNILFLFADDMGYGDTSLLPFKTKFSESEFPCTEGGILTPQLERMASEGVIMTNFHASAPVCSPSRTSVMTGLYPWRMTAMNAFELGRDPSQRNGFLPQIPTTPEILRENGYFTMHSGKWHLGGMREEQRRDRVYSDQCSRPSPNQHGFEEYVSELDGPESPRYTFLLSHASLHSQGHRHLLKDDVPVPIIENPEVQQHVLSDREGGDAIEYMKMMKEKYPDQPWFIQIWFNAPHGPWEVLLSGEEYYNKKYNKSHDYWARHQCRLSDGRHEPLYMQRWFYKTMVSAMDKSIGTILDAVRDLGIEQDTLIVFTTDNGHEMGAGDPGPFKEGKRSIMEGGVRVPTIWKWKGVIPENSYTTYFGAHTDLLPTFLNAARVAKPANVAVDGISLLPVLTKAAPILNPEEVNNFDARRHIPGDKEIQQRYFGQFYTDHYKKYYESNGHSRRLTAAPEPTLATNSSSSGGHHKDLFSYLLHEGFHHVNLTNTAEAMSRVFLWHKDTDPYSRDDRMQSGGYYDQIKILTTSPRGCLNRIFDMKYDAVESFNLYHGAFCAIHFDMNTNQLTIPTIIEHLNRQAIRNRYCGNTVDLSKSPALRKFKNHISEIPNWMFSVGNPTNNQENPGDFLEKCGNFYFNYFAIKIFIILKKLIPLVKYGNHGHQLYMRDRQNHATCNIPIVSDVKAMDYVKESGCEAAPFGCSVPEF